MKTIEWLTVKQASLLLGFTVGTIYRMVAGNKIPCYRPGGTAIRFDKQELLTWAMTKHIPKRQASKKETS